MTMTTMQYWSRHVAAVKAQAITTRAYAQRQGLVLSTLYYWQHTLKLKLKIKLNPYSQKIQIPQSTGALLPQSLVAKASMPTQAAHKI